MREIKLLRLDIDMPSASLITGAIHVRAAVHQLFNDDPLKLIRFYVEGRTLLKDRCIEGCFTGFNKTYDQLIQFTTSNKNDLDQIVKEEYLRRGL